MCSVASGHVHVQCGASGHVHVQCGASGQGAWLVAWPANENTAGRNARTRVWARGKRLLGVATREGVECRHGADEGWSETRVEGCMWTLMEERLAAGGEGCARTRRVGGCQLSRGRRSVRV